MTVPETPPGDPDLPPVETDLDGCDEVYDCPRCGRPFRRAHQRDLHLGESHDDLDDAERDAYEAAAQQEQDDLFFFHIKVVVALGVLYSSTVLLYTAVVGLTG